MCVIGSLWFLLDSVRVSSGGHGCFSHYMRVQNYETASMGLIFVPFILGIIALVYTSGKWWSWFLMWSGIGVIVIEMLSRIRFMMNIESSYLILVFILFAVGTGLMLKSNGEKDEKD